MELWSRNSHKLQQKLQEVVETAMVHCFQRSTRHQAKSEPSQTPQNLLWHMVGMLHRRKAWQDSKRHECRMANENLRLQRRRTNSRDAENHAVSPLLKE